MVFVDIVVGKMVFGDMVVADVVFAVSIVDFVSSTYGVRLIIGDVHADDIVAVDIVVGDMVVVVECCRMYGVSDMVVVVGFPVVEVIGVTFVDAVCSKYGVRSIDLVVDFKDSKYGVDLVIVIVIVGVVIVVDGFNVVVIVNESKYGVNPGVIFVGVLVAVVVDGRM